MSTTSRRSFKRILSLALVLLAALPLVAFREPDEDPIRARAFRHPDLHISSFYQPATELGGESVSSLSALGIAPEAAYFDRRGGRWGTLMPAHPILPGDGVGNDLRWEELGRSDAPASVLELRQQTWEAFVSYLGARQSQLGIDVSELRAPGTVTPHRGGELIQIHAQRVIGGVPVRDSFLNATISHGNLILLGARNWGDVDISPVAAVTMGNAIAVAQGHLGDLAFGAQWRKNGLSIVPMAVGSDPRAIAIGSGYDYRLVWSLRPDFPGDPVGDWEALVDAHSGELLALQDNANYASTREVVGGVYPVSNDGVPPDGIEVTYPMPFADVANAGNTLFTGTGGKVLACIDGDIATTLTGQYMNMIDTCGPISETTSGDVLDLGSSGGIDCTTPAGAMSAGNTHASRSGFYELNRVAEWGRSHLPLNTWLRAQLPATMNIAANCNASGGPGGVNFFTSGGGCSNTGEIAGVFDHEWGHGMDGSDATPGISSPGEGIADLYAALRLNTSCIGRNFRLGTPCGGYGDPCTSCDGVRDIDWANRASGTPHDIAFIDTCGPGNTNGPCGGSVHCEGAVYAEAVWDLWNRDLTAAPFSQSLDTAQELTTRLTFVGAGAVGTWFNCVAGAGTGDGCNADGGYLNYLAADDDDGMLGNGTPHMSAINAAFVRHGIACPTPAVTNAGCGGTPTTAPAVTATAGDRGVTLTWGAVGGASSYRVYRGEGEFQCGFGKILLADTTDTSYIDSGLQNGREYSYIVTAMGPGDSCIGPASTCDSVTPSSGANLALAALLSGGVDLATGDGDAFLDNCEEGTVTVAVSNVGTGNLTDLEIVDVRPISHPAITVTSTLPIDVSTSLGPCETVQAAFSFQADGLALGDAVQFEVDFTSNQLGAAVKTQVVDLAVPGTESDLQNFASRTFSFETDEEDWAVVEGTFNRTTTGAGSGGNSTDDYFASSGFLPGQCDHIRSPVMSLNSNSTMTLWTNFNIEDDAGGTGPWYDRANIGVYDVLGGSRSLVEPSTGRDYNASGANGNCGTNGQRGWAGTMQSWATSTFNATALGSAGAPDFVQLDVLYGTDSGLYLDGFWFDEVTVTNVDLQVDDTQSNVCGPSALIFTDGFESGNTLAWSSTN